MQTERALLGRRLDEEATAAAADEARRLDAMSDVHVSAAYRRHIAGVVTRRALADAGRGAEVTA
jgi:carbon-monoxide dehydrogenase medium subunit